MADVLPKKTVLKDVKVFKDLEEEIIKTNKCCACGACVAYCSSQTFDVIKMEGYTPQFISDANVENCKECGVCYYICPQTEPLMKHLKEDYRIKDEIGFIQNIIAAKTKDEIQTIALGILENSTWGIKALKELGFEQTSYSLRMYYGVKTPATTNPVIFAIGDPAKG